MAKVVMAVTTSYGSSIKKGDVVDVPDEVAARWVKFKIATYADGEEQQQEAKDDVLQDGADVNSIDYNEYKAAELQQIAKDREIEGWSSMKKAELVEALKKDDRKG